MKANIKISLWVPLVFILIMVAFLIIDFNILDVIIILGVLLIVIYFVLGYVKRKNALVIEGMVLMVRSPIKTNEFDINDITTLALEDHGTILRGVYQGEKIKLITNIYDIPLLEIKDYLLSHYSHIKDETK